jgi:hypothetical protein
MNAEKKNLNESLNFHSKKRLEAGMEMFMGINHTGIQIFCVTYSV